MSRRPRAPDPHRTIVEIRDCVDLKPPCYQITLDCGHTARVPGRRPPMGPTWPCPTCGQGTPA